MLNFDLWGGIAGGGLRSTAATQSSLASGDGAAQKNATIASIASKPDQDTNVGIAIGG